MQLQKYLQEIGLDNRRNIRKFIREGLIKVNNKTVEDPKFDVDPNNDKFHFKGKLIKLKIQKKVYFIFNKPVGVVSTLHDPQGRLSLKEFIKGIKFRIYPVGRLDYNSEGLMILTNDGEFTNYVLKPKNKIPKVYQVKIKGVLSDRIKEKMEKGFVLDGRRLMPFKLKFLRKTKHGNSWWMVTIFEGKKHIIRKVFKYSGYPVERLKRISIGNIRLKKLKPGYLRELTYQEVESFKKKYFE